MSIMKNRIAILLAIIVVFAFFFGCPTNPDITPANVSDNQTTPAGGNVSTLGNGTANGNQTVPNGQSNATWPQEFTLAKGDSFAVNGTSVLLKDSKVETDEKCVVKDAELTLVVDGNDSKLGFEKSILVSNTSLSFLKVNTKKRVEEACVQEAGASVLVKMPGTKTRTQGVKEGDSFAINGRILTVKNIDISLNETANNKQRPESDSVVRVYQNARLGDKIDFDGAIVSISNVSYGEAPGGLVKSGVIHSNESIQHGSVTIRLSDVYSNGMTGNDTASFQVITPGGQEYVSLQNGENKTLKNGYRLQVYGVTAIPYSTEESVYFLLYVPEGECSAYLETISLSVRFPDDPNSYNITIATVPSDTWWQRAWSYGTNQYGLLFAADSVRGAIGSVSADGECVLKDTRAELVVSFPKPGCVADKTVNIEVNSSGDVSQIAISSEVSRAFGSGSVSVLKDESTGDEVCKAWVAPRLSITSDDEELAMHPGETVLADGNTLVFTGIEGTTTVGSGTCTRQSPSASFKLGDSNFTLVSGAKTSLANLSIALVSINETLGVNTTSSCDALSFVIRAG